MRATLGSDLCLSAPPWSIDSMRAVARKRLLVWFAPQLFSVFRQPPTVLEGPYCSILNKTPLVRFDRFVAVDGRAVCALTVKRTGEPLRRLLRSTPSPSRPLFGPTYRRYSSSLV
uniref:Uncharacterized protein n=1 Tax=Plectus sambesii TaxID=2011161 RepID=A0A914ULA1_9BILA